ncbi:MAG TPA: hypothetical protein VFJ30_15330, partial [Phycisphaerae bacterium]|nr:hypothetical protein [Phycisphaerae bacterium]
MMQSLVDLINEAYQPARHRDLLVALWEQEVWFDAPRQRASAEISRTALEKAGLSEARLASYPCDGKTRFQDWT